MKWNASSRKRLGYNTVSIDLALRWHPVTVSIYLWNIYTNQFSNIASSSFMPDRRQMPQCPALLLRLLPSSPPPPPGERSQRPGTCAPVSSGREEVGVRTFTGHASATHLSHTPSLYPLVRPVGDRQPVVRVPRRRRLPPLGGWVEPRVDHHVIVSALVARAKGDVALLSRINYWAKTSCVWVCLPACRHWFGSSHATGWVEGSHATTQHE